MKVLVVMHDPREGPAVFGDLLAATGAAVHFVRLHRGERLPFPGEADAAIVLGGPMNVYEEVAHPWLRAEDHFLREAAERDFPVLGICLGAQLIAKAAGAAVTKNPVEEIGWHIVELTADGQRDPLFRELPEELPVLQWHGDTFAIPAGGLLLATGADCRNQALRYRRLYGLQFHVEADRGTIREWFAGHPAERAILRRYDELTPMVGRYARTLLENFLDIARRPR